MPSLTVLKSSDMDIEHAIPVDNIVKVTMMQMKTSSAVFKQRLVAGLQAIEVRLSQKQLGILILIIE